MDGDGGSDEEGKEKDARDEEDFVKQEQDSKEFIALQEEENLIKMNVPREVTDSKGLPMEEIIKQEEEEEIIKQEDEEEGIKQEEEEEKDRSETDVEVWQDSRPLHYHPISTSVSGWLAEKIWYHVEIIVSHSLGPLHADIRRWSGNTPAGEIQICLTWKWGHSTTVGLLGGAGIFGVQQIPESCPRPGLIRL